MRTLLTLDYEVFFGRKTGTVRSTLLEPTDALLKTAARHGAKLVFFVDAGFILRMRSEMHKSAALREEHDAVCRQVESVARDGHEVQLHIHPHWEDSRWDNGWQIDTRRYALHAFAPAEIRDIVTRYAAVLRELAGPRSAFAYRAGGWVIQPFEKLGAALRDAGVSIDSTVYAEGRSEGAIQPYDFKGAPAKSRWRFEADPLVEVPDGHFLEVPIASRRVHPEFFWRFAAVKKLGGARHRAFGDGAPIALESGDLLRKLLRSTHSVVSMDGYKAGFLARAAEEYRARDLDDFVVIGHPKAQTPFSIEKVDEFLASRRGDDVTTFAAYQ
jgi:peptidoglycan/xylan/chitin deacetylase (PgdA/CDA1 family)